MRSVWPVEVGYLDVFEEGDPCPGETICDKYGLVQYGAHGAIATSRRLPSLGVMGLDLLMVADPDEYRRVTLLAHRRSEALRRTTSQRDGPPWLFLDMDYFSAEFEEGVLTTLGLTLEGADALLP